MTNDKIRELMGQSGLLSHLDDCMPGVGQWEGMDELMGAFVKLVREETIRECVAVCEQEQAHWQMQAPGAADGRYDWKADGAEACADELRSLLEQHK